MGVICHFWRNFYTFFRKNRKFSHEFSLTLARPYAIILHCAGIHSANLTMQTGGIRVLEELSAKGRVVGVKQTLRAIREGRAQKVYLAVDAEDRVLAPLQAACEETETPVDAALSRKELGRQCGIEVGTAAAAVLKK
jgi:large subunit ribosomal protein L7A